MIEKYETFFVNAFEIDLNNMINTPLFDERIKEDYAKWGNKNRKLFILETLRKYLSE